MYGLRRTGKTTIMGQAIAELDEKEFEKTAFLQVRACDTLAQINKELKKIQRLGFEYIFIDALTWRLKEALVIRHKNEQVVEITDAHKTEIKEYLDLLDLTVDISVQSLPVVGEKEYMTVIFQPGLRYSQANELIRQLLLDPRFQDISAKGRKRIIDRILDEIKDRMMEEIVLLETKKAFPQKEVFKLKFAIGEFDMVVYDPEEMTCEVYEIKHSKEAVPQQYRHLNDSKKCEDTEFRYGTIVRKCVIYRGETMHNGVMDYVNVEEYLNSICRF